MVRKTLTYEVPGVRTVVTHNIRPKTDTALDQRKVQRSKQIFIQILIFVFQSHMDSDPPAGLLLSSHTFTAETANSTTTTHITKVTPPHRSQHNFSPSDVSAD